MSTYERDETGADVESTTPHIRRDPEGGQGPEPTQPEQPDENGDEEEPAQAG